MPPLVRDLFVNPRTRWPILAGTLTLFTLFSAFDLRSNGMERNFSFANMADVGWVLEEFGPLWVYGGLVLNLATAAGAATLMALAFTQARARRGAACSTTAVAPVAIAFGTFTCPGCILPVTGLVGASVAATSLPLLGLEIKALALAVVALALVWVARSSRNAEATTGTSSEDDDPVAS